MNRIYILVLSLVFTFFSTSAVFASGGYGGGGGGFSTGNSGFNRPAPRPVDQTYEVGKSIFLGRQAGEPALEYCIVSKGEKVPVKRSAVKEYKNVSYDEFARNLYQCDQPEKPIAEGLTRDSFLYVIYYLNKRHKLGLKGA